MEIRKKKNYVNIILWLTVITFSSNPYALAHSSVPKDSVPKANEIVEELPSTVFVDFKDKIEPGTATLVVLDPTGKNIAGKAESIENRITAKLIKKSKYSGIYKISYRAISVDGTTIQSFITFGLNQQAGRLVYTISPPVDNSAAIVIIVLLSIPLTVIIYSIARRRRRVR